MTGLARWLPQDSLLGRGATLFVSNGVGQALSFFSSVAIARILGVESFGQYAAIMALVFVVGLLVEAGLEATLTREVAIEPHRSWELLRGSFVIKLSLGAGISLFLVLSPVSSLLAPSELVQGAVQLTGPLITLMALNASFAAVFRAWGRMNYVLLINITGLGLQLTGTLILLILFRSIPTLFAWLIAVQCFELWMGAVLFRKSRSKDSQPLVAHSRPLNLLRSSWPFALAGALGALTLRIDLFLIEALHGSAQVGVFSAGTRLSELLALAPNSFFAALFPEMSALYSGGVASSPPSERIYRLAVRRMAQAGLLLTLIGLLFADMLVWLAFGPAFAGAATPLRVLSLTLMPLLVNRTTTVRLYATHQEHRANGALVLNLTLRFGLGALLIPGLVATGAALAGLIAECVIVLFYWLTGSMGGGSRHPRQVARMLLRRLLGLRFRRFKPGIQPNQVVKVAGLRLHVYATVFNPRLHFTSEYLAKYLRRAGVVRPGSSVLDLGTGSGIAAIVAAQAGAGRVIATDINPAAVRSVIDNAQLYNLAHIVTARQGDMFEPVRDDQFDLIITNPPYLRGMYSNIAERAYMGGNNLEWFDSFTSGASQRLLPRGRVLMILGDVAELEAILNRFKSRGWHVCLAAQRSRLVEDLYIYELEVAEVQGPKADNHLEA